MQNCSVTDLLNLVDQVNQYCYFRYKMNCQIYDLDQK